MGAQGLGLGVVDGVFGIVRKPIEGKNPRVGQKEKKKYRTYSFIGIGALHGGAPGFAKGVIQGQDFFTSFFFYDLSRTYVSCRCCRRCG